MYKEAGEINVTIFYVTLYTQNIVSTYNKYLKYPWDFFNLNFFIPYFTNLIAFYNDSKSQFRWLSFIKTPDLYLDLKNVQLKM